ncbi:MAG TPA: extracellular solute-binding protein, partial [Sphaerochaeta sp.]|nr:extracellular solute-binding protein [Sphaerochaeta sp.]
MRKVLLILGVLLASATMLFSAGQADKAVETGPSKVSMYANITAIEPILERYKAESGVEVEYTRLSTARYVSTILTEVEAKKLVADVVQGPLPVLEILREYGVLSNYEAKAMEGYPDWAKKDGIHLFGIEYVGLIYNKDLVSAAEAPKTLDQAVRAPFREFLSRAGIRGALLVLSFIFLYKLGDSLCTALATPFYLDMGFTKTEIGLVAKNAGLWPSVIGGLL